MAEQRRAVRPVPEGGQAGAQRLPGGRTAGRTVQADEVVHAVPSLSPERFPGTAVAVDSVYHGRADSVYRQVSG
ncbi:hypothetical protein GCM10022220_11170 [Actinocatenispora rupis]